MALKLEGSDPAPIAALYNGWRGGAVMIFPEGGRGNPDGSMKSQSGSSAHWLWMPASLSCR